MSLGLLSRWPDQVSTRDSTPEPSGDIDRDPPAVLLAEDDPAVGGERLAVGSASLVADEIEPTVGPEPVGPARLHVLEQEAAIGQPERSLGELEPLGQGLDLAGRHQVGKSRVAQDGYHVRSIPSRVRLRVRSRFEGGNHARSFYRSP